MTAIPQVGDTVWAAMHTTDDRLVLAEVTAEVVDKLGCGCHRITATRPGPVFDGACTGVQLLTGCGYHPRTVGEPPTGDVDPHVVAVLARLHVQLARSGEDVHAGRVERLRAAVSAGVTASTAVVDRLGEMRCPANVRLAIEKAIAELSTEA